MFFLGWVASQDVLLKGNDEVKTIFNIDDQVFHY